MLALVERVWEVVFVLGFSVSARVSCLGASSSRWHAPVEETSRPPNKVTSVVLLV